MTCRLRDTFPQILITEKEYLELKRAAGYWQGLHQKILLREEALKQTVKEQEGKIRDLTNRMSGKKSEKKGSGKKEGGTKSSGSKRPQGQQSGSKGYGRTDRPHLPRKEELVYFPEIPKCTECGIAYVHDGSDRETEIIEVEVKAHTRVIIRSRIKFTCLNI